MLWKILKLVIVIIVLIAMWLFLRSYAGNITINDIISGERLVVTDAELWEQESDISKSVLLSISNGPHYANPESEYIKISASHSNSEVIDMTGWSVQSLVSDTRVYIPPATLMLKMQRGGNTIERVNLAPGEYIILRTGRSPIAQYAQSFHTNRCIGYLDQFINFEPKVKRECTRPSAILPATIENVRTYGSECIEFLQGANRCTTYSTAMPAHLLPICRDLIARKLNYHTCLSEAFEQDGYGIFDNGGWYLYLGHDSEIWRNNYEAIRLLDVDGKVVDVMRY